MSVGGTVLETIVLEDRVWIDTNDRPPGRKPNRCAIYVEKTPAARAITPGDTVWWQGRWAFWTPRSLGDPPPFIERKLARIGASGVERPTQGDDQP